jgi:hypothetical protein
MYEGGSPIVYELAPGHRFTKNPLMTDSTLVHSFFSNKKDDCPVSNVIYDIVDENL